MTCEHKRRGITRDHMTVFCKDCRDTLAFNYDAEVWKWESTGEKYPDFWCRHGWHKWCKHPMIKSDVVKNELAYVCTDCGLEHEHDHVLGKWYPKMEEKRCLRCGEVRS